MSFPEKFGRGLFVVLCWLAVTGGFRLKGAGYSIELASIDAFAALFCLCLGAIALRERDWRWDVLTSRSPLFAHLSNKFEVWSSREGLGRRLSLGICFVFGSLALGHLLRHAALQTHVYDMAFQHQPLSFPWFEGRFLACDMCTQRTLLGEHLAWTWALLSPLALLFRSDAVLFFVQAGLAAAALALFIWRGPLREARTLAFGFFLLFVLFRPFRESIVWDFREDLLGFFFVTVALVLLSRARPWASLPFWILAALSKESFPLLLVMTAPVLWFESSLPLSSSQRRSLVFVLFVLGAGLFVINSKVITPAILGASQTTSPLLLRFPGFGSTAQELLVNALTRPFEFLALFSKNLFRPRCFTYLLMIFLPFAPWIHRRSIWLLPVFGFVFLYMLSSVDGQTSGSFHYELIFLPLLWMNVASTWTQLKSENKLLEARSRLLWSLALAALVAGRGPLFEVTDRAAHENQTWGAAWAFSQWELPTPIAAPALLISHFTRAPSLRYLQEPGGSPGADALENRRVFLRANPLTTEREQLRDWWDARAVVLDLQNPWQAWLFEDLFARGMKVIAETGESLSPGSTPARSRFQALEISTSILQTWCQEGTDCPAEWLQRKAAQ